MPNVLSGSTVPSCAGCTVTGPPARCSSSLLGITISPDRARAALISPVWMRENILNSSRPRAIALRSIGTAACSGFSIITSIHFPFYFAEVCKTGSPPSVMKSLQFQSLRDLEPCGTLQLSFRFEFCLQGNGDCVPLPCRSCPHTQNGCGTELRQTPEALNLRMVETPS